MRKYFLLYIMLACLPMASRGQTITDLELSEMLPLPVAAQSLRYWFDGNTDKMQTVNGLSGSYILDLSSLDEGIHTLHYQVKGVNGQDYDVATAIFLKTMNSVEEPGLSTVIAASKLQYWFDSDTENMQEVSGLSGTYALDVSLLTEGVHTIHYQVVGMDGTGYDEASEVFIKLGNGFDDPTIGRDVAAVQLQYWFDGDIDGMQTVGGFSGTYTLDVASLADGVHTLYYQLLYDNGHVSPAATGIFFKDLKAMVPEGPNEITKYQYWLNENSPAMRTVAVNNTSNPYTQYALLPMQKEPIRSSSFHFEVKDNVPTIYAKNDLHIRFYDARSYFVDDCKSFIDYGVSQEVEPVGELQATQTFPRVSKNNIRWYTITVEAGDTTAFRLSQPATVQVFAPSGKEVFTTSASASVQWSGIHTWENGTYYVAVHDVTGSQSNMTLDYMHMDKYDVVDWDVHTVGDGGCSTITFKGNGFRDLYAVDLYTAEGDSIHSVDVSHESDAETAVTFDFSGAEFGMYDAVFHFTEEEKIVSNVVNVEEAKDIELATEVSFPSSFLSGTSTTYTIKITNKGNMTAYDVPLTLRIITNAFEQISKIVFDGHISPQYLSNELQENIMDDYDKQIATQIISKLLDIISLIVIPDPINDIDYALTHIFTIIPPYSTKQITVSIQAPDQIELEAYTPSLWYPVEGNAPLEGEGSLEGDNLSERDKTYHMTIGEWLCCYREKIECVVDVVAATVNAIPGVPANINCSVQIGNTLAQAIFDIGCSEGATMIEKIQTFANSQGRSFMTQLVSEGLSCVLGFYNEKLNLLRDQRANASKLGNVDEVERLSKEMSEIRNIKSNVIVQLFGIGSKIVPVIQTAINCYKAFTQPSTDCPAYKSGGGGTSTPYVSKDPNDIYGHLSETGTHFIADSVARVNYTIEFENDTAFATAAAHSIVVKDTLDRRYFDLDKFMPTGVRIGSKEEHLSESDIYTNNGRTSFVKTIDMRPEIYAIAQVEGDYDHAKGIATWTFTSLDPMSMEPTDDLMQGILPVNWDGTSGIGEVMFEVGVKPNKGDGTEVKNRAGIVFDYEESIITPTWVNTVDAVAPTSSITDVTMENDTIARLHVTAQDNLSGVWYYDVYAQYGQGAMWVKVGEHVTDSLFDFRVYEDIDYGFCVLAVDSAGNVEKKKLEREWPQGQIPTSITNPDTETETTAEPVYDLGGRQVPVAQEGIYVQKGRKRVFRRK